MSYEDSRDDRRKQATAARREDEVMVICKHLVFLHLTPKGGLLVQEGEPLAGDNWRVDGKKTWLPMQACRVTPNINTLEVGDELELELPKRLAVEKELFYEGA